MKKRKTLYIIILSILIISLSGVAYAYIRGGLVSGNPNTNPVNIDLTSSSSTDLNVSYDETYGQIDLSDLVLDLNTSGGDVGNVMKFTVSNVTAKEINNLSIRWNRLNNTFCRYRDEDYNCTNNSEDVYVANELSYALYECTAANYTSATSATVSTLCSKLTNPVNLAVPATGDTSILHSDTTLSINGLSTNYYVLQIIMLNLNSNQVYHNGANLSLSIMVGFEMPWSGEDCESNSNLLNCKIVAAYPPKADSAKSEYVAYEDGIDFSKISSVFNGQGLYENIKNGGDGMIKYFRGGDICTNHNYTTQATCETAGHTWITLNNYVSFANKIWRIISINSDGEIRIMTQDGQFTNANDYFYTKNDTNTSRTDGNMGTNSTLLNNLNNWYTTNIVMYSHYINQQTIFCADSRQYTSGSSYSGYSAYSHLYRMAYKRIASDKKPSFACPVTDQTFGGEYIMNIGIISADEVAYAGGVWSTANSNYYLKKSVTYWTASNIGYDGYYGHYNGFISDSGSINEQYSATYSVFPVIELKNDVHVASGTGLSSDPWIIETTIVGD